MGDLGALARITKLRQSFDPDSLGTKLSALINSHLDSAERQARRASVGSAMVKARQKQQDSPVPKGSLSAQKIMSDAKVYSPSRSLRRRSFLLLLVRTPMGKLVRFGAYDAPVVFKRNF